MGCIRWCGLVVVVFGLKGIGGRLVGGLLRLVMGMFYILPSILLGIIL